MLRSLRIVTRLQLDIS